MMTSDELARLMELPVDELRRRARIPFRLLPDRDSLISDFAHSLLDQIRTHGQRGEPARFILPVGPVAQYRQVV
ncbi:MAG: hypothetical protein AAB654_10445, partial [Acidobacteriota bacterium]